MTDELEVSRWEGEGGYSPEPVAMSWTEAVTLRDAQMDAKYGGNWETRVSAGAS